MLQKLEATDQYFVNFKAYMAKSGLMFNLDRQKPVVKRFIAAEFARQLFNEEDYFQIVLREDPMVKTILSKK